MLPALRAATALGANGFGFALSPISAPVAIQPARCAVAMAGYGPQLPPIYLVAD